MINIDKNISIPNDANTKGRGMIYPFPNMEIGDSFYADKKHKASAQAACRIYGLRHNMKFCTRKENTGIRIWRYE